MARSNGAVRGHDGPRLQCIERIECRQPRFEARCRASGEERLVHHHVAGNVWHSAGAGRRDEDRAGLSWFSLEADPESFDAAKSRLAEAKIPLAAAPSGIETADPWGTHLRLVRA